MENEQIPTHVDLFSGIGGFALAAKWAGFRAIAFCEIDKYCQKILAKNFGAVLDDSASARCETQRTWSIGCESRSPLCGSSEKILAKNFLADAEQFRDAGGERDWSISRQETENTQQRSAPRCYPNIFDFDGTAYRGCDLLTGGFPCQPFSVAGKRRGTADDRALWPEMFRVINEARPAWLLGENVPGIIPMELDNVLSDLESIGYATRTFVIPACAVDARHRRDRLWIIGRNVSNNEGKRLEGHGIAGTSSEVGRIGYDVGTTSSNEIANPDPIMPERSNDAGNELRGSKHAIVSVSGGDNGRTKSEGRFCQWLPEPDVGRVANGVPSRVDRLKGLGNAIVPQVAYEILKEIRRMI